LSASRTESSRGEPVQAAGVPPAGYYFLTPGSPRRVRPVAGRMAGVPTAKMAVLQSKELASCLASS